MSALEGWAGVGAGTCSTAVISRESLRAQSQAGEQRLAFCFVVLLFRPCSHCHSRDGCAAESP